MSFPRVEGYVIVSKIGSGSYSTVYKGYNKVGKRSAVAVKCVEKSRLRQTTAGVDNLLTEIKVLKSLAHPHIIQMREFLWDNRYIFIVMEWCAGDLSQYIHRHARLPEITVRYFLQQLASALQFLREKGIAHMDLKPQNLLLKKSDDGRYTLKVADFGFAKYLSDETRETDIRGSPLYMAPEMLSESRREYSAAADLWSVGVIMYECLFGHAPYSSQTLSELLDKIKRQQPIEFPRNVRISDGCGDLLTRLLQHDPDKRITHEQFFRHEYLDLEHRPCRENYEKGVKIIHEAVAADAARQTEEAFELYRRALLYLVPCVSCEPDAGRRQTLRATTAAYMERAEQLKLQMSGATAVGVRVSPDRAQTLSKEPRRRPGALAQCCTGLAASHEYKPTNETEGRSQNCNCTGTELIDGTSVNFTNNCACRNNAQPNMVSRNASQNTVPANIARNASSDNTDGRTAVMRCEELPELSQDFTGDFKPNEQNGFFLETKEADIWRYA